ncbi:MAG: hypothetical protein IPN76_26490 [Saprospiraceae bacterium]|nr:hypothetical protein [Saprospiraceae bacterium]
MVAQIAHLVHPAEGDGKDAICPKPTGSAVEKVSPFGRCLDGVFEFFLEMEVVGLCPANEH